MVGSLPHKEIQEFRPSVPPMAEQLGVVRRDDQRWPVKGVPQPGGLREARFQEMSGVPRGGLECRFAITDGALASVPPVTQ